jgi:hypothetical protein
MRRRKPSSPPTSARGEPVAFVRRYAIELALKWPFVKYRCLRDALVAAAVNDKDCPSGLTDERGQLHDDAKAVVRWDGDNFIVTLSLSND